MLMRQKGCGLKDMLLIRYIAKEKSPKIGVREVRVAISSIAVCRFLQGLLQSFGILPCTRSKLV